MFKIASYYNKDTMCDTVKITLNDVSWVEFDCPNYMSMEDYCSAVEGAINRLTGNG